MLCTVKGKGIKSHLCFEKKKSLILYAVYDSFLCWRAGCSAGQGSFRKRFQETAEGAHDRWDWQTGSSCGIVEKVGQSSFSTSHTLHWKSLHILRNYQLMLLTFKCVFFFFKSNCRFDSKIAEGEGWALCSEWNCDATCWKAHCWKWRLQR